MTDFECIFAQHRTFNANSSIIWYLHGLQNKKWSVVFALITERDLSKLVILNSIVRFAKFMSHERQGGKKGKLACLPSSFFCVSAELRNGTFSPDSRRYRVTPAEPLTWGISRRSRLREVYSCSYLARGISFLDTRKRREMVTRKKISDGFYCPAEKEKANEVMNPSRCQIKVSLERRPSSYVRMLRKKEL